MLFVAAGAEERHTSNSRGVGAWASCSDITIDATSAHTGNAHFVLGALAAGQSQLSEYGTQCWWSGATAVPSRTNGTYWTMFSLFADSSTPPKQRYLAWYWDGASYYLSLNSNTTGTRLATSTHAVTAGTWHPYKLEFDNGTWTCWAIMDASTTFTEEFTYTETSPTAPYSFKVSLNGSSDESKTSVAVPVDDICAWDTQGDNWNSRLSGADDYPRISVAHVLTTPEETASQAALLDEIPVSTDYASASSDTYWATPPALDASVTNTIQAVMITHVATTNATADIDVFNIRENSTLYTRTITDTDDDWLIQKGGDGSATIHASFPVNAL